MVMVIKGQESWTTQIKKHLRTRIRTHTYTHTHTHSYIHTNGVERDQKQNFQNYNLCYPDNATARCLCWHPGLTSTLASRPLYMLRRKNQD